MLRSHGYERVTMFRMNGMSPSHGYEEVTMFRPCSDILPCKALVPSLTKTMLIPN